MSNTPKYLTANAEEYRCLHWPEQDVGQERTGQRFHMWLWPRTYKVEGTEVIDGVKCLRLTHTNSKTHDTSTYYVAESEVTQS